MANAIREITVARGIDPRGFALLAFGGAGPLHAVAIAEELQIGQVVVPANPGVLSAWGMLHTDTRHDLVQSFFVPLPALRPDALTEAVEELAARGRELLHQDGVEDAAVELVPSADLRYRGQEYAVSVAWALDDDPAAVLQRLPSAFAEAHLDRYGHNNPGEEVECVNLRLAAFGRLGAVPATGIENGQTAEPLAPSRTWFGGDWHDTPVYRRDDLGAGAQVAGPAILIEDACTVAVPPGWSGTVSERGHLTLTSEGHGR
jgi:N-methylhydantoinase A